MTRNPLTGEWKFLPIEIWQETDHQAHVKKYWENRIEKSTVHIKPYLGPMYGKMVYGGKEIYREFRRGYLDLPLCDL